MDDSLHSHQAERPLICWAFADDFLHGAKEAMEPMEPNGKTTHNCNLHTPCSWSKDDPCRNDASAGQLGLVVCNLRPRCCREN